jgi:dTDP-4-dehydrorhamnose reductase
MNVAVTGASGLFGQALVQAFGGRHDVYPLTRADADITQLDSVRVVLRKLQPDVVIHTAAIRDLDICETDPALGFLVNFHGTRHVVEAARQVGAAVAHISTDAVFDGKKPTPYIESDIANPPTVYGRVKLRAEGSVRTLTRHWIFRVSILFGPGKTNLVEDAIKKVAEGREVVAPLDQIASATYTPDASRKIVEVVEAGRYGLYHLANQGACSRFELVRRAVELARLDVGMVKGVPLAELGRPAARLKYAIMEMKALQQAGFGLPRPWPEALAEYVSTILPRA